MIKTKLQKESAGVFSVREKFFERDIWHELQDAVAHIRPEQIPHLETDPDYEGSVTNVEVFPNKDSVDFDVERVHEANDTYIALVKYWGTADLAGEVVSFFKGGQSGGNPPMSREVNWPGKFNVSVEFVIPKKTPDGFVEHEVVGCSVERVDT